MYTLRRGTVGAVLGGSPRALFGRPLPASAFATSAAEGAVLLSDCPPPPCATQTKASECCLYGARMRGGDAVAHQSDRNAAQLQRPEANALPVNTQGC